MSIYLVIGLSVLIFSAAAQAVTLRRTVRPITTLSIFAFVATSFALGFVFTMILVSVFK
jgi:hypothetical protein